MNLIPNAVTVRVARQVLIARKNSPTMLFVGGVVGVIGSTVLACRATLKVGDTLDTAKFQLDQEKTANYATEHDRSQVVASIYVSSAVSVAKLYAPSALLGVASIGALTASNRILHNRNMALTAAYAAVDEAFRAYRERVVEKYGEEEDRHLRYEHEEVRIPDENGKHSAKIRATPGAASQYARFFCPMSPEWQKEHDYNLAFLRSQQIYWNDVLQARGHVFLNEVYKSLGLEHTSPGAIVGWIIGGDTSDNYIDFGLFRNDPEVADFVNGREGSILLDFNVDGVIFDKLNQTTERIWRSQCPE